METNLSTDADCRIDPDRRGPSSTSKDRSTVSHAFFRGLRADFRGHVSILGFIVFLLSLASPNAMAQVTQICDTQPVPAGQVVVRRYTGNHCPGVHGTYQNATLDIQNPVSPMTMCSESPYPSGYIIAAHLTTNECWNLATSQHTRASWTMRLPRNPDLICTNSHLPNGYVITQVLNSSTCFNPSGTNQASSYSIKVPGQQETVCSFSPIPVGYTVIQLVSVPNCSGSNGGPGGQGYVIRRS